MALVALGPAPVTLTAVDNIVVNRIGRISDERILLAADSVRAALEDRQNRLETYVRLLRRDEALIDALVVRDRQKYDRELLQMRQLLDLDMLALVDEKGERQAFSSPLDEPLPPQEEQALLAEVSERGVVSGPAVVGGRCLLRAAAPLRRAAHSPSKKDERIGAIIAAIVIDERMLASLKNVSGADVALVVEGVLWRSTIPGQKEADYPRSGIRHATFGETPYESVSFPIPAPPDRPLFHLVVYTEATSLAEATLYTRLSLSGIIGTSLMVAIWLALFVARGIVRPVRQLQKGAARIGAGDFSTPINVTTGDEIQQLAEAFNRMAEDLSAADVERRRYLTELEKRRRQMLLAERHASLGRMAAHVAHEVGNPLTSISSFVQILRKKNYDEFTEEALVTISRHIDRIATIVSQLTGYARPTPEQAVAVIGEVVRETFQLLTYDRRLAAVRVGIQPDIDQLPPAAVDPGQLQQVFVNLILNAAEAMPDGGKLTVTGETIPPERLPEGLDEECSYLAVRFTDTGPGVPPEQAANVFEPFYTTKGEGSGAGIGLALSFGIVQRFGGELSVKPGGPGATFSVALPLARNEEKEPTHS